MSARASLKARWAADDATIGAWCFAPHPFVAEAVARAGFDFAVVDMQHGPVGFETAFGMIQAIDLTPAVPVVRVPWNEPAIIGQVLDAGALAVIVPMIEGVEDAQAAVRACRYPPMGRRSFGPLRVGMRDGPGYAPAANDSVALMAMIETPGALEQCEAIAALPGVDALFVGPFDLSVSLGLPPGDNDGAPAFDAALARVVAAATAQGKVAGILSNANLAARRVAQGFQFVSVFSDIPALAALAGAELARARQSLKGS
jgi:4-hydroxy-2-oxoheptanedioate aldolase